MHAAQAQTRMGTLLTARGIPVELDTLASAQPA